MTSEKNPTSELSARLDMDALAEILEATDETAQIAYLLALTGIRSKGVNKLLGELRQKKSDEEIEELETLEEVLEELDRL